MESTIAGPATHEDAGSARLRVWALALLAYVLTVGAFLLAWNAVAGGLVEGWYQEYMGPNGEVVGSGKWRSFEGKAFQDIALLFGIWVYPLSILAALMFVWLAGRSQRAGQRLFYAGCGGAALYVLYRLLALGLFTAVTSF